MMDKLFEIHNLKCTYDKHYVESKSKLVLEIKELVIPKGKKIFIVGESGIGKSTILELLGLMNNTTVPSLDSSFVFYDGDKVVDLLEMWKRNNDDELSAFRLKHFNFIFQSTNLMRNFTAYENISLTRMLQNHSRSESFDAASIVLKDLGLGHIDKKRMAQELSGGQQQRLAFARAILPDFSVLFGDEPTGNLDSENAIKAMQLLTTKLNEYSDRSAIIVSHDMHLATAFADVIIRIRKKKRTELDRHNEISYYGLLDSESIFLPDAKKANWSNGLQTIEKSRFEIYLKTGGQK